MEHDDLPGINDYGDLTFDDQVYYRDVTVNSVNFYDAYQSISECCELEDIVNHVENKIEKFTCRLLVQTLHTRPWYNFYSSLRVIARVKRDGCPPLEYHGAPTIRRSGPQCALRG